MIEVPDEWEEVGEAMAQHLEMSPRTVGRFGGGKTMDCGGVQKAIAEATSRAE